LFKRHIYRYGIVRLYDAAGAIERELRIGPTDATIVFSAGAYVPEWGISRAEYETLRALPVDDSGRKIGAWRVMASADYILAVKRGERFVQKPRAWCGGRK